MTALPTHALSLYAPWSWAILHAGKRIENRSARFPKAHRGPFWIHCSLFGATLEAMHGEFSFVAQIIREQKLSCPPVTLRDLQAMRGKIVGMATVVDYVTASDSPWFCGPTGIVLRDVKPVNPVAAKGALGFWRVPAGVIEQLENPC